MGYHTKKNFIELKDVSACLDVSRRDRFRILLLRKGLTQNALANEVGITKGTMSKIIAGDWEPASAVRVRIAEVLECDSLVLFGPTQYFLEWKKTMSYPPREERGNEN